MERGTPCGVATFKVAAAPVVLFFVSGCTAAAAADRTLRSKTKKSAVLYLIRLCPTDRPLNSWFIVYQRIFFYRSAVAELV